MRRKALERMHVEVIELTSAELFDTGLFHATVLRIALRLKKQLRPEGEGSFTEKRALLRSQLLVDSSSDDAEETSVSVATNDSASANESSSSDEYDPFVWTEDPSSWNQEDTDDESWIDGLADSDDSWVVDVPEWNDEDLFVFGAGRQKENPA